MAQNDRTTGLVGMAGMKVPCRAATTANITLSGEQTIDGVACVTDDRVLVKDQTDGSENGIWVVDTGAWTRAPDFKGTYDIVSGSQVRVNEGSSNATGIFAITTADPITIGTTAISFVRETSNSVSLSTVVASAGQTLVTAPTYQIGSQRLAVYLNGLRQRIPDDYTETSTTSITFTDPLAEGDEIDMYAGQSLGNVAAAAASVVSISDAGDFLVAATVEAALQEMASQAPTDLGDASATFTNASSSRVQRWNTPLTVNRTLTLSTSNAKSGARVLVVRGSGATGAFTLAVGSLATLRAPGEWALCGYDAAAAAWVLIGYGILPSAEVLAMSADKGDASASIVVGTAERTQLWATALTAERTATLSATGAWRGARFRFVRAETASGAFSLVIASTVTLCRLAPGQWCEAEYTGTAWAIVGFGDLRPALTSLIILRDQFVGSEIDGYRWQSLIGTDGSARQATVRASQAGGVARLTTGADAGATMALNGVQLHSDLNWRASQGGLVFEARVALDAITSVVLFVGLTDQIAALEMPFTLGAGDALTSNATNAVGVLFDTAADTDNWWLVGVAADVDATKQNAALAPVAATFETWRIEINATGQATFYRNGTAIGTLMTGALTATSLLTPVVAGFSRTSASRNIDVDHIAVQAQQ